MNESQRNWYAYHFGHDYANSPGFNPDDFFGQIVNNCYVLMADFCSFTRFFQASENLNDIEPLIRQFYTSIRDSIHRHDGMLDKIMGDGCLAIWGLHSNPEDIEKKILCAISEIKEVGMNLAEDWQDQIDLLIKGKGMRFGLSKGKIMIIKRNQDFPGLAVLGEPINLASRLQTIAPANELVCSNLTYNSFKKLDLGFSPCNENDDSEGVIAKHYGHIKAWKLPVDEIPVF